jgi:hypothetical protein
MRSRIKAPHLAVLVAVLLAGSLPAGTSAGPGQESPTEQRRAEVRAQQGEVALDIDVLEARNAEIQAALATLAANVAAQEAELDEAERAAAEAAQDVVAAEAAVAAAEARVTELSQATDEFVVDAYVNPPSDNALDVFSAESISDATIKQTLLHLQATNDADVLDQLEEAREDRDVELANMEAIAAEAEAKRVTAEQELAELEAAQAQQAAFAVDAEAALDRKLVEAENLSQLDAELSRQIAAEQAELARQLELARQREAARQGSEGGGSGGGGGGSAPAGPGTIAPAPGGLATVSCPGGGSITVAGSLGPSLRGLLDAAGAAGVQLCGWGYRSGDRQVALRRSHCGSSDYAIWHMPAWQCSPPTARPGRSMHEQGLAVDFTCGGGSIGSRRNSCFRWLSDHAASFGLYNLPSEPWHWSTTGQ